jgi:hypothetical protein
MCIYYLYILLYIYFYIISPFNLNAVIQWRSQAGGAKGAIAPPMDRVYMYNVSTY